MPPGREPPPWLLPGDGGFSRRPQVHRHRTPQSPRSPGTPRSSPGPQSIARQLLRPAPRAPGGFITQSSPTAKAPRFWHSLLLIHFPDWLEHAFRHSTKVTSPQSAKRSRQVKGKEDRTCYNRNSQSPQPFPFQLTPPSQSCPLTSSAAQPPLPDRNTDQNRNHSRT